MQRSNRINYKRLFTFITVVLVVIAAIAVAIWLAAKNNAEKPKIEAISSLTPTSTPYVPPTPPPSDSPDESGEPSETLPPDKVTITVKAVGDIAPQTDILAAALNSSSNTYDFTRLFSKISEDLASDFTIASFESVCVDPSVASYSGRGTYNTPVSFIDAMKGANIDAVTLANSHILDQGMTGIEQTRAALDEAGIQAFGAFTSQEDSAANRISIVDVQGIKIAVLAYSSEFRNNTRLLSSAQQDYAIYKVSESTIVADVNSARSLGADVVIVCAHWGELMSDAPTAEQRSIAQSVMEAGADVIIGTHAQWVQKITNKDFTHNDGTSGKGIVAYCLGNFVSEYREQYNDTGIILSLQIEKDMTTGEVTISDPSYISTWIDSYTDGGKTVFEVLPMYKYIDNQGSLTTESYTRLQAAWKEVQDKIADAATCVTLSE